jgi:hypothetical protein
MAAQVSVLVSESGSPLPKPVVAVSVVAVGDVARGSRTSKAIILHCFKKE